MIEVVKMRVSQRMRVRLKRKEERENETVAQKLDRHTNRIKRQLVVSKPK